MQCGSDVISDALQENTRRIQARMHHIKQTMIDYYSTLVWCEHRVSDSVYHVVGGLGGGRIGKLL